MTRKFRIPSRKRKDSPAPQKMGDELKITQLIATAWAMFVIDLPADEIEAVNAVRIGNATPEQKEMFAAVKLRRTPFIQASYDRIHPGWRKLFRSDSAVDTVRRVFTI